MSMTFEAPIQLAGQEQSPALAVFSGDTASESPAAEVAAEEASETPQAEASSVVVTDAETVAMVDEVQAAESEDDRFFEELELLGKLADAEQARQEASYKFLGLKEELKEAKEILAGAETKVHLVASDIANFMAGKNRPTRTALEATQDRLAVVSNAAGDEVDNSWRNVPTSELLAGVKGLGKKKLETLCDIAKTAGALEDLRASSNGVFKTVLPNGFGDKVASAIEDALLLVSKPSAGRAADQVEPRVERSDEPGEFEPLPIFANIESTADKINATEQWDAFRKKTEQVNELDTYTLKDCEFGGDDSEQFVAGYKAFEANEPVHACDGDTYDAQCDWVMGWCVAKRRELLMVQAEQADDSIDNL